MVEQGPFASSKHPFLQPVGLIPSQLESDFKVPWKIPGAGRQRWGPAGDHPFGELLLFKVGLTPKAQSVERFVDLQDVVLPERTPVEARRQRFHRDPATRPISPSTACRSFRVPTKCVRYSRRDARAVRRSTLWFPPPCSTKG